MPQTEVLTSLKPCSKCSKAKVQGKVKLQSLGVYIFQGPEKIIQLAPSKGPIVHTVIQGRRCVGHGPSCSFKLFLRAIPQDSVNEGRGREELKGMRGKEVIGKVKATWSKRAPSY